MYKGCWSRTMPNQCSSHHYVVNKNISVTANISVPAALAQCFAHCSIESKLVEWTDGWIYMMINFMCQIS